MSTNESLNVNDLHLETKEGVWPVAKWSYKKAVIVNKVIPLHKMWWCSWLKHYATSLLVEALR